jgi:hypothetical protein
MIIFGSSRTFSKKRRRRYATPVVCVGQTCSFAAYYLGIRVAPQWVAFTQLGIIWLGAGFRAAVSPNILVATDRPLGEHWLGINTKTLYDSPLVTVETLDHVPKAPGSLKLIH